MTQKDIATIVIPFVISLPLAAWVNRVTRRGGGRQAPWTIATILVWPVTTLAAGWRFRNIGLVVCGLIGSKFLCRGLDVLAVSLLQTSGSSSMISAGIFSLEDAFIWALAFILAVRSNQICSRNALVIIFASVCNLVVSIGYRVVSQLAHSGNLHHDGFQVQLGLADTSLSCLGLLATGLLLYVILDSMRIPDQATKDVANH